MKRIVLLGILLTAVFHRSAVTQMRSESHSEQERELKAFLVAYVQSHGMNPSEARYAHAFIDLDGDGIDEAIVYLSGRDWCGTGGCQTLILKPRGTSYRRVGRILATRPPIRVLTAQAHGWHTLTAWVAGGGILSAYEAGLPFDGEHYPISGASPSAHPLVGRAEGKVVISGSEENVPLVTR